MQTSLHSEVWDPSTQPLRDLPTGNSPHSSETKVADIESAASEVVNPEIPASLPELMPSKLDSESDPPSHLIPSSDAQPEMQLARVGQRFGETPRFILTPEIQLEWLRRVQGITENIYVPPSRHCPDGPPRSMIEM